MSFCPPPVRDVAVTLGDLPVAWAIAGGWALDLALGRTSRAHADVDVAVFRDDQQALREALPAWEFGAVVDEALVPWAPGARLERPVHEVHARLPGARPPRTLEFLLNERDGAIWVYRRDHTIRRALARAFRVGACGIAALAPEIVLLFKSKAPRPVDEYDFRVAQPLLDPEARAWLRAALERTAPGHPWAVALAREA